jgi:hypothetical protein
MNYTRVITTFRECMASKAFSKEFPIDMVTTFNDMVINIKVNIESTRVCGHILAF